MWPIINKLFIWRETCFFDGSELKKNAALPYCVSKELSLKFGFCTRKRETVCSLFSTGEERPRFVWGSLFAYRPVLSSWVLNYSLMTPCYNLNVSGWHVNTWSGWRSPRCLLWAASFQCEPMMKFGSRGREQTAARAVSCCFTLKLFICIVPGSE